MKKIFLPALAFSLAAALHAPAADAKATWDTLCTKCHGADGKGQTKMGKVLNIVDLTDAKVQADLKDDAAFKTIKEGKKDKDDKTLMKANDTLSDDEIKALIVLVRGFKQ
jgi:cytochrome c553